MPSSFQNTILQRLPQEAIDRLKLKRYLLPAKTPIEQIGREIEHVFFLEQGAASFTATFASGQEIEIGLAGYESVLGASVLLGTRLSLNRVYMQIAGWGYVATAASAKQEFARWTEFAHLVLKYTQAQFIQSAQTAGCNAIHLLPARLARWLLLCDDRMR